MPDRGDPGHDRGDPGDHGQDHDPGEIVVITLVIIVPIFTDVPGT
jgi:hypothetical protein